MQRQAWPGLMKTVLALEHAQLPASLHFQNLNPHIELKDSPFFVNSKLTDWAANGSPRRAGVTALGIGGTNAHVVLEEAPPPVEPRTDKALAVADVSAKTDSAAEHALYQSRRLPARASRTELWPTLPSPARLAAMHFRIAAHWSSRIREKQSVRWQQVERKQFASGVAATPRPPVVFLFSGQGSQYADMGRDLYENEPVFRETLDLCAQHLLEPLGTRSASGALSAAKRKKRPRQKS